MQSAFMGWGVKRIAAVSDYGLGTQYGKPMGKTLGDEQLVFVFRAEHTTVMLAKST
jgi:hypothetical protein